MQFYKIEGIAADENWAEENNDRQVMKEKIRRIASRSRAFNQKLNRRAYFYVTDASEDTVELGAICCETADIDKLLPSFLNAIALEMKDICIDEVTLNTTRNMLTLASRFDYIRDDDEVLERFELDKLNGSFGSRLDFNENMFDAADKDEIYREADRYFARDSFLPELDRIYAGGHHQNVSGHPVHYFIQTDDRETRKGMYRLLLQALYANG